MSYCDMYESYAESPMVWLDGEEVRANLSWDERFFYLWFEVAPVFEDFCEDIGGHMLAMLEELRAELEKIGVRKFGCLESVNDFCKSKCGDNCPANFYYDDIVETVCGGW